MAIYTDNFNTNGNGDVPANWTSRWRPGYFWCFTSAFSFPGEGANLEVNASEGSPSAFTYELATSSDIDIVFRFKNVNPWLSPADPITNGNGIGLRLSGVQGSETGYFCEIRKNRVIAIRRFNSGVETRIGSTADVSSIIQVENPFLYGQGKDLWMRAQIVGSNIKVKVWAYGETEPAAWNLTHTDTSPISASGWNGIIAQRTGVEVMAWQVDNVTFNTTPLQNTLYALATTGADVVDIDLAIASGLDIVAVEGADVAAIVLDLDREVTVSATDGADVVAVRIDSWTECDISADLPHVASDFTEVLYTFLDFDLSFPIATSFTSEGVELSTFGAVIPLVTASFESPIGERLSITLQMVESAFTETDQGVASFTHTLPMLFSSFVGGELLVQSFDIICVNARTKEHSTYTNFPFNSFARFNGVDLACSSTGIHALGGDLDGTADIDAELYFGLSDCGAAEKKRVDSVWVRARLSNHIDVQIEYDEVLKTPRRVTNYSGSDGVQTLRARGSRGAEGNFIRLGLSNVAGSDFEVLDMEMDAVKLSGR